MADAQMLRLELDSLHILVKRERWKIYFLVATELPDDPSKTAVARFPDGEPIQLTRKSDNEIAFVPKGSNAEGMFLLERPLPADGTLRVGVYVMQARSGLRKSGDIMEDIGKAADGKVISTAAKVLGAAAPWMVIGNLAGKGVASVGKLLADSKDRQLGYISMDEAFANDFADSNNVPRSAKLFSGKAELAWSWVLSS